jgi:hypothetical protein
MMRFWRRISLGLVGAFAITALNLPASLAVTQAATTPTAMVGGRALVEAPDPPAAELARSATSSLTTPGKAGLGPLLPASNHVRKLDTAEILKFEQDNGAKVLESSEGRFTVLTETKGVSYLVTLSDGVLKSGRAVIGIATQKLTSAASANLVSVGPVRAYASTSWFLACSYATRANSWSDLYVYICPRDVYLLSGTLGVIAAATAIFGGPVGIGIATALGLAVVVSVWHFMNNDGSIGITIPAWTIQAPFGGWIYYWNRLQAYMYNECWIRLDNWWYKPYCWW